MGNKQIEIREPLVDENFNELETAKQYIHSIQDVSDDKVIVTIYLNDKNMLPTAIYFSLKKRLNFTYKVIIQSKEPWTSFADGFLRSSPNIESVIYDTE